MVQLHICNGCNTVHTGVHLLDTELTNIVSQQVFGADLSIFGYFWPGHAWPKFFGAEILLCKVQCDNLYRRQQYRPNI